MVRLLPPAAIIYFLHFVVSWFAGGHWVNSHIYSISPLGMIAVYLASCAVPIGGYVMLKQGKFFDYTAVMKRFYPFVVAFQAIAVFIIQFS